MIPNLFRTSLTPHLVLELIAVTGRCLTAGLKEFVIPLVQLRSITNVGLKGAADGETAASQSDLMPENKGKESKENVSFFFQSIGSLLVHMHLDTTYISA